MSMNDRRPLAGQPVTRLISQHNDNRFGAVLSALYGFWTSRSSGTPGGRRDAYTVINFDHTVRVSPPRHSGYRMGLTGIYVRPQLRMTSRARQINYSTSYSERLLPAGPISTAHSQQLRRRWRPIGRRSGTSSKTGSTNGASLTP